MTTITRVKKLDIEALEWLREESLLEGFRFIERMCTEWTSGTNRFTAPGEALFLAIADDRIVGVCGLNCDPFQHDPFVGRVRRLYVARAHRRAGVGRTLLETVILHAQEHFRLLRLRTEEANEFFLSQGFRRIASEENATHFIDLKRNIINA